MPIVVPVVAAIATTIGVVVTTAIVAAVTTIVGPVVTAVPTIAASTIEGGSGTGSVPSPPSVVAGVAATSGGIVAAIVVAVVPIVDVARARLCLACLVRSNVGIVIVLTPHCTFIIQCIVALWGENGNIFTIEVAVDLIPGDGIEVM